MQATDNIDGTQRINNTAKGESGSKTATNSANKEISKSMHNYQSHFSPLKALKKGDEILFKNVMGKEIHFIVMETEVLEPVQIKEMTGSDFDLSLFTCTYGGSARYTIRCNRLVE